MKQSQRYILSSMIPIFTSFLALWVSQSFAYTIVTDEAAFFSQYQFPSEIIDFNTLKDGSIISNIITTNPYWTGISVGGELVITESAWSDIYFIRSAFSGSPNASIYNTTTKWNGSSIAPNTTSGANFLSIYTNIDASAIALYTTVGFVGVIPDDINVKTREIICW